MNHQEQKNRQMQRQPVQNGAQRPSPTVGDPASVHPVRRQRTQKNQKKMQAIQALIITVIALVLVAGILLLSLPMFKVKEIVVVGNSIYTEEEIIAAAGIAVGDEIISIAWDHIDTDAFYAACPLVDNVKVSCGLSKVTITVEE